MITAKAVRHSLKIKPKGVDQTKLTDSGYVCGRTLLSELIPSWEQDDGIRTVISTSWCQRCRAPWFRFDESRGLGLGHFRGTGLASKPVWSQDNDALARDPIDYKPESPNTVTEKKRLVFSVRSEASWSIV